MVKKSIRRRPAPAVAGVWTDPIHPVIQRLYAARGVNGSAEVQLRLAKLLSPHLMGGMVQAVAVMIDAIVKNKHITVAGDYDCDGCTGTAVAVRGFRMLGASNVRNIVPDRFKHGYGLSKALVDAMDPATQVIVTVDSGTSSFEGVAHAKAKGMQVVITDHHLPAEGLPDADAIVNPNLTGEQFPSKALAGVGVMLYLLLAIRHSMREQGMFASKAEPDLTELLDIVALGTVADLVPLDYNNRVLVDAGLRRIRAGKACPGIMALLDVSEKPYQELVASDIAFTIAPKLNAAGRLVDMALGVRCLLSESFDEARVMACELNEINAKRKEIQATMTAEAEALVAKFEDTDLSGVSVYEPTWNPGVVGLVASKLKENLHRPVIAFAPAGDDYPDEVRASGRSIDGFHLRDALAIVDVRNPGMMPKYGGHAMAAGLSLKTADIPRFTRAFNEVAQEFLTEDMLEALVMSDGELAPGQINLDMAYTLRQAGPWGQAFPEPVFDNVFEIVAWRTMGTKHFRGQLRDPRDGAEIDAIMFFAQDHLPPHSRVRVAYELGVNTFLGKDSVRLLIRHLEPA